MKSTPELEGLYDELGWYLESRNHLQYSADYSSIEMKSTAAPEKSVAEPELQRKQRIKSARTFLARRYRRIHFAICGNAEQRQKILQCDEASVVTVLADCLAPFFTGVPIFTVANLIARVGIKRLCEGNPFAQRSAKKAR
jgi:hypothetical protein